jgi:hypothetical protein
MPTTEQLRTESRRLVKGLLIAISALLILGLALRVDLGLCARLAVFILSRALSPLG